MAFEFGYFNEYSDSVTIADPVVAAVAKAIKLGPWVGQFYQAMGAPETTIDQKRYEIYARTDTSRNGVVGSGGWDNDDVADLPVTSAFAAGVTRGHVIRVEAEVMIISEVDRANNQIDVFKRGDAGTTAASHSADKVIEVIGYAGNDFDLKDAEGMHEVTNKYTNYVQTVFEIVDWTKHGDLIRKGLSPAQAAATLVTEAENRVAKMLGTMAINGYKNVANNNSTRYMSAGLIQQLTDNAGGTRPTITYNASGDLTEEKLLAALKSVFDAGGSPDTIWVSPTVKGYVNCFNIANSSLALTANRDNHGAGGQYIDHVDYEGNILNVRVDRDMPNGNLAIVNQTLCRKGWLLDDGLRLVDEPSQSSREIRKSLQGSVGFIVEGVGYEHCLMTGITGGPSKRTYDAIVAPADGAKFVTLDGGTASA